MIFFSLLIDTLSQALNGISDRLQPSAIHLAYVFILLGTLLVIYGAMTAQSGLLAKGLMHVIAAAFYLAILNNVYDISVALMSGATEFGLAMGGAHETTAQDFLDGEDSVFARGAKEADVIYNMATNVCKTGVLCFGTAILVLIPAMVVATLVWLAFGFAALSLILVAFLLKISMFAGMLLLPMLAFRPTASFGFLPIKLTIHGAMHLMILTFVITAFSRLFESLAAPTDISLADLVEVVLGSFSLIAFIMVSGKIAHGMANGTIASAESLFHAAMGGVRAVGGGATGAANAAAKAATLAAGSVGSLANGVGQAGRALLAMQSASRRTSESPPTKSHYERPYGR